MAIALLTYTLITVVAHLSGDSCGGNEHDVKPASVYQANIDQTRQEFSGPQ